MTITVDVEVVRQHRAALLAEADDLLRTSALDPPETGALSALTAEALERLSGRAERLADHQQELADALDRWLRVAHATDGQVGLGLDLLTAGVLGL